jgi:hypothetical protein
VPADVGAVPPALDAVPSGVLPSVVPSTARDVLLDPVLRAPDVVVGSVTAELPVAGKVSPVAFDGLDPTGVSKESAGSSFSVRLVHCVPFHQRMVLGCPVGSGYQPAGGLLMRSP